VCVCGRYERCGRSQRFQEHSLKYGGLLFVSIFKIVVNFDLQTVVKGLLVVCSAHCLCFQSWALSLLLFKIPRNPVSHIYRYTHLWGVSVIECQVFHRSYFACFCGLTCFQRYFFALLKNCRDILFGTFVVVVHTNHKRFRKSGLQFSGCALIAQV
jgi:hypothetical protein